MSKIIHYTNGYGGKLNYKTYCGKEIHSHSETEDTTLVPSEVTCDKCKETEEWREDYTDSSNTASDIKRRIYIESDFIHATELSSAQREVRSLCKENNEKYVRRIFSEVLEHAWHDLDKTWKSVKKADEIYSDSSLLPLCGNDYMGAPVIFNGMCERAIKENITGKTVVILNSLKNIYWHMIDLNLMKKAFKKNDLFMYDESHDKLIKIDVLRIKEQPK